MKTELTTEDKQRIEQKNPYIDQRMIKAYERGYTDATIYERQQQKIKSDSPIGERFEKEFGTRSDYFNHRVGLFMDMKDWIVKELEAERSEFQSLLGDILAAHDQFGEITYLVDRIKNSLKK